MSDRPEERFEPLEKARDPEMNRAPKFEEPDGVVPDPSKDTELTEEDRENPMVNDSSFTEFDDKETKRPG